MDSKPKTPKEKYNCIIDTIEELVNCEEYLDHHSISDIAFKTAGLDINDRMKNGLFDFMMGKTVIYYIRERKAMAAYKHLVERDSTKDGLWPEVQIVAGDADQSALNREFNEFFQKAPLVARKDYLSGKENRYIKKPDWETLTAAGQEIFSKAEGKKTMSSNGKFGLDREKYAYIDEACDLQDSYGLNDEESEIAFNFAASSGRSLKDSFRYTYEYLWHYISRVESEGAEFYKIAEKAINDPDRIFLFFDKNMDFSKIERLLVSREKKHIVKPIWQYDMEFIEVERYFGSTDDRDFMTVEQYEEIKKFFKGKKTSEFKKYDLRVFLGIIEELKHSTAYWTDNNGVTCVPSLEEACEYIMDNFFTPGCSKKQDIENYIWGENLKSLLGYDPEEIAAQERYYQNFEEDMPNDIPDEPEFKQFGDRYKHVRCYLNGTIDFNGLKGKYAYDEKKDSSEKRLHMRDRKHFGWDLNYRNEEFYLPECRNKMRELLKVSDIEELNGCRIEHYVAPAMKEIPDIGDNPDLNYMWDRQYESYGKGTIREAYLTSNESMIIDVDYDNGEERYPLILPYCVRKGIIKFEDGGKTLAALQNKIQQLLIEKVPEGKAAQWQKLCRDAEKAKAEYQSGLGNMFA